MALTAFHNLLKPALAYDHRLRTHLGDSAWRFMHALLLYSVRKLKRMDFRGTVRRLDAVQ